MINYDQGEQRARTLQAEVYLADGYLGVIFIGRRAFYLELRYP
jgi:hypothetical protein